MLVIWVVILYGLKIWFIICVFQQTKTLIKIKYINIVRFLACQTLQIVKITF